MSIVTISSKGQITIPAKIRNLLGLRAKDKLRFLVRGNEVIVQPVKPFRDFRSSVIPKKGNARAVLEKSVAEHVNGS